MCRLSFNKLIIISFFSAFLSCIVFVSELQALPRVELGQAQYFNVVSKGFTASNALTSDNSWQFVSLANTAIASDVSSPAIRIETIVVVSMVAFFALILVFRALGLRYYVVTAEQRAKALEEEKAEYRRSLQVPKVTRPVEGFSKRLDMALGAQIPSDIALPSVFRAENSDLCALKLFDVPEPKHVDIEQPLSEDVEDAIDNALCDMHALMYNINVAIEKIHSNPLSTKQARSILIQSQIHARAIQDSLREIQSDLANEDVLKRESV